MLADRVFNGVALLVFACGRVLAYASFLIREKRKMKAIITNIFFILLTIAEKNFSVKEMIY